MTAAPPPATRSVDNSPSTAQRTREAQIIELHEAGLPSARIAKALRMPASSIRSKLNRLRTEGRLTAVAPAARDATGPSRLAGIVEGIEAEAARLSKIARMDYLDATAALKAEYRARQDEIAAREAETLKEIERRRIAAIAAAEGLPISLGDFRSVKGAARGGAAPRSPRSESRL